MQQSKAWPSHEHIEEIKEACLNCTGEELSITHFTTNEEEARNIKFESRKYYMESQKYFDGYPIERGSSINEKNTD